MRTLHLDPFSGVAGDMLVGALLDLGAPFEAVRDGLATLPLDGYELSVSEVMRGQLRATKFDVRVGGRTADSPAAHAHAEQHLPHRGLVEIREILAAGDLPRGVHDGALATFELLARAEARSHGSDPETVHFHEVGAVDAICDIVAAHLALASLRVEAIHVGTLRVGSGFVHCAHGELPVPGPATLECLAGFDVRFDTGRGELVTPTGAALVASIARPGAPAELRVERVGYGAGTRDPEGVPNVLRAVLGDVPAAGDGEPLVECVTNVDHLAPNVLAAAADRVRAAGAVDVFTTPCTMKKGRVGHRITALVPRSLCDTVLAVLFAETGTLGVRSHAVERTVLSRTFETVSTPWGEVRVKLGRHAGRVTSREPEFEDCRALAAEHDVPVADVMAAARRAEPTDGGS